MPTNTPQPDASGPAVGHETAASGASALDRAAEKARQREQARETRLASALRENLLRRKAQVRARAGQHAIQPEPAGLSDPDTSSTTKMTGPTPVCED